MSEYMHQEKDQDEKLKIYLSHVMDEFPPLQDLSEPDNSKLYSAWRGSNDCIHSREYFEKSLYRGIPLSIFMDSAD